MSDVLQITSLFASVLFMYEMDMIICKECKNELVKNHYMQSKKLIFPLMLETDFSIYLLCERTREKRTNQAKNFHRRNLTKQ